ncbi:MAG: ComEC/Rec2 family competence protein [Verrucomicrobia bacterium]|nr:ComEC/Rec2 family competence protein [Verrucomicrobiota bacterium]
MKATPFFRQRYPFLGILLAAIAGILLSSFFSAGLWLLAVVCSVCLLLFLFRRQGGMCWAATLAVFALLHLWNWDLSPTRNLTPYLDSIGNEATGNEVAVRGIIIGEPKISRSGSATFPLRLEELRGIQNGNLLTKAPLTVQVRWAGNQPSYGDRVLFQGIPVRPAPPRNPGEMDYRRWLERHGITIRFELDPSIPGTIESSGHGNPLMVFAIRARHRMEEILSIDMERVSEVRGAIEGICLGVIEHAPEGFTDDFRFTGTMHLFAVSGLHVGMLAVILWFALKAVRIPRTWAVILTIPTLFFFVLVTGMKIGSIRSATMASILLIGITLFRRSPLLNTLAAAAFFQLALDTNDLFSAGWQFSYSVVFAIIVAAPRIEAWLIRLHEPDPFLPAKLIGTRERWGFRAWNHVSGLAAVSASAWIGAIIPTLAYFHLISFSAFGANLLAVPLAFLVISLGALSLVAGTFSSWIAGAFNNANWLVTKLLLFIVQTSALMPGGHWFVGASAPAFPIMTILDLRGGSCAVIRDGSQFVLINAGKKRDAVATILPCLESLGANSIRSCLITKLDASHLGGLPIVSKEIPVSEVLVSSTISHSQIAKGILSSVHSHTVLPGKPISLSKRVSAELLTTGDNGLPAIRILLSESRILVLPLADQELISSLSVVSDDSLHADVLMMPLGGAQLASTLALITRIAPKAVITPVDPFKQNGVPSGEWERLLAEKGIKLFRQNKSGALFIESAAEGTSIKPFLDNSDSNR